MDVIVTVDLYFFDAESKNDAIDKAMAGLERGGLYGDVLVASEGERESTPDPQEPKVVRPAPRR